MTSFIPPEHNTLLLKIHELTLKNEKVTFTKLSEFVEKKELCKALDYLCNKCVIDDVWDKSSGQWIRTFEIVRQYIPFVEKLRDRA